MAEKTLEPGTLDRTRKNIGEIDPAEALMMQKKLGGEILKERSVPVDTSNMPKRQRRRENTVVRASGHTSSEMASQVASSSGFGGGNGGGGSSSGSGGSGENSQKKKIVHTDDDLPDVTSKELKLMDRLMMSPGFDIKPDYGFFNVFYRMSSRNKERLQKSFGDYLVKRHIEHMQGFISTIKTFIQISPDSYKAKISTDTELKFKFLRTVGKWTMKDIKVVGMEIENAAEYLTVPMMIPFVKLVYRQFLQIYYVGAQQISLVIKDIYSDLSSYPNADKDKLQNLAKQGATEWLYVHDQVIKGLYPLLMRMCATSYDEFPDFFKSHISEILKFLGMSKFDLLLPEKKGASKSAEQDDEKKKKEESKKAKEELANRHVAGKKDETVSMGLKILDQMFPFAGFNNLDNHPDMFPYFQPIYGFDDGFNVLNPENPLQVTIVLLRIIEDFFKGCRNIRFNLDSEEKSAAVSDRISDALSDWASYREDLFDKKYGDYLRNYVNSTYSQREYPSSQRGKEDLNNLYWRCKYYFLPHYKFNAPVLQKPINDSKYKPLFGRTDYVRTVFTDLIKKVDAVSKTKGTVPGVSNPWERYNFDLPNPVSKRIDVLLGAKKPDEQTAATNANLMKYTLCVVSVLDWWINNPSSPAYSTDASHLFRISAQDGAPEFSVPVRTDQNTLFAEAVKRAVALKKSKNS